MTAEQPAPQFGEDTISRNHLMKLLFESVDSELESRKREAQAMEQKASMQDPHEVTAPASESTSIRKKRKQSDVDKRRVTMPRKIQLSEHKRRYAADAGPVNELIGIMTSYSDGSRTANTVVKLISRHKAALEGFERANELSQGELATLATNLVSVAESTSGSSVPLRKQLVNNFLSKLRDILGNLYAKKKREALEEEDAKNKLREENARKRPRERSAWEPAMPEAGIPNDNQQRLTSLKEKLDKLSDVIEDADRRRNTGGEHEGKRAKKMQEKFIKKMAEESATR